MLDISCGRPSKVGYLFCERYILGTHPVKGIYTYNVSSVIAKCTQLRGFWYISGRRGMRNPPVEYNVAAFSELSFSFAARWQGRLSRG